MYQVLKAKWRDTEAMPPKAVRKEGYVPGVIFGKDMDSVTFQVDTRDLKKFLAHSGQVFEIDIQGKGKHLVNLDDLQKNHLGNQWMHLSLHKIKNNEKITITLPVQFEGEAVGTKGGGIVNADVSEVHVKGYPGDMPEYLSIDVSALDVGGSLHVSEVNLPSGLEWAEQAEMVLVHCAVPKMKIVDDTPETDADPMAAANEAGAPAEEASAEDQKKAA